MSYFLMINSKDCANFYKHNAPYDFTIELPRELELGEKWECALTEINFNNTFEISQKVQEIYVFCDVCEDSFIRNHQLPILRRISLGGDKKSYTFNFIFPYYINVSRNRIKRIRIYLTDDSMRKLSFLQGMCSCTLHLRKKI